MNNYTALMDTAIRWSKESYCARGQVGCVIARESRIVSIGYNGTISGTDNVCEERAFVCRCGRKIVCTDDNVKHIGNEEHPNRVLIVCRCGISHEYLDIDNIPLMTSDLVMHAEQNALMFCTKNGISTDGCTIYVTKSPCEHCSKLLASSGIVRVVYLEEYKITHGLDLLRRIGVDVIKYKKES